FVDQHLRFTILDNPDQLGWRQAPIQGHADQAGAAASIHGLQALDAITHQDGDPALMPHASIKKSVAEGKDARGEFRMCEAAVLGHEGYPLSKEKRVALDQAADVHLAAPAGSPKSADAVPS